MKTFTRFIFAFRFSMYRSPFSRKVFLPGILTAFLLINSVSAQTAFPELKIDKSFNISLNEGAGLSAGYTAAIGHLGFLSEAEAKAVFEKLSDNMVDFRVDYARQKVTIHFLPQPEGAVQMDDFQNQSKVLEMKFRNYRESLKKDIPSTDTK